MNQNQEKHLKLVAEYPQSKPTGRARQEVTLLLFPPTPLQLLNSSSTNFANKQDIPVASGKPKLSPT